MNGRERTVAEDNREVYDFYENGAEIGRLERGLGIVEAARTKELLGRFLTPGMSVCDVGGGVGYYASWLAGLGHQVTLIELAPSAVEYARLHQPHPFCALSGDARNLSCVEGESVDAVLLLGPLYHLLEKEDRLLALREAFRVLKPGGLLAAAGISKFSSATWALSTYGVSNRYIDDEDYFNMLREELTSGEHHRPDKFAPRFLTRAYFHTPEQLLQEIGEAGFCRAEPYAVEGCIWFTPDLEEKWSDPGQRRRLLELIRLTERQESLLGMSPHFLVFAEKVA